MSFLCSRACSREDGVLEHCRARPLPFSFPADETTSSSQALLEKRFCTRGERRALWCPPSVHGHKVFV